MQQVYVGLVLFSVAFDCSPSGNNVPAARFDFTVQQVFYIEPPVDRVILVGMVNGGKVRAGDSAVVTTSNAEINVVVEGIEGYQQGDLFIASSAEQVGLRVRGLQRYQVNIGDKVRGKPRQ